MFSVSQLPNLPNVPPSEPEPSAGLSPELPSSLLQCLLSFLGPMNRRAREAGGRTQKEDPNTRGLGEEEKKPSMSR